VRAKEFVLRGEFFNTTKIRPGPNSNEPRPRFGRPRRVGESVACETFRAGATHQTSRQAFLAITNLRRSAGPVPPTSAWKVSLDFDGALDERCLAAPQAAKGQQVRQDGNRQRPIRACAMRPGAAKAPITPKLPIRPDPAGHNHATPRRQTPQRPDSLALEKHPICSGPDRGRVSKCRMKHSTIVSPPVRSPWRIKPPARPSP